MNLFKSTRPSLVLAGLIMFSTASLSAQTENAANIIKPASNKVVMSFSDFVKKSSSKAYSDEDTKIMRPLKEDVYSMHQGDWFLESNNVYEYDFKGRRTKEVLTRRDDMGQDVHTRISLKYNEDNMVSEFLEENAVGDAEFLLLRNTINEYDAVRRNVQVLQKVFVWDDASQSWDYRSSDVANMYREVERDEQGRVTLNQMWSNEEKITPYTGYEFEYDESGPASKMAVISTDEEGFLMRAFVFEDLVWHKSDCQYLKMSSNVLHTFSKDPLNQIKSYTVYVCNQDGNKAGWAGNYEATYDEQDRQTRVYVRMPHDMGADQKYLATIAYDTKGKGSIVRIEKHWVDKNDNDVFDITEELMDYVKYVYNVDDKGNPTSEEWYQGDVNGDYVQVSGMKYETEYTDFGAIKQRISYTFNPETQKYEYLSKAVYSDFIDVVAGIDNVSSDKKTVRVNGSIIVTEGMEGAPYSVFDAQGRKVMNGIINGSELSVGALERGLYIVRIGKADKTVTIKIIKD